MERFEGVANTLFVPLVARISVSKQFPDYFYDEKALEMERYLPEGAAKGSSQYTNMASTARYYNMDRMVGEYIEGHDECNIVYLGVGLETARFRIAPKHPEKKVHWYGADLPDVIEARRKVYGEEGETLLPGDMFDMKWAEKIPSALPTLLIVSGVFQYFHNEDVRAFIKSCAGVFQNGEMIFDATNEDGLKFTNWFIKRTGNASALMYFYVNDAQAFADSCETELISERVFFADALRMLGRRLNLVSRVSMSVADKKKRTIILHIRLNPKK